MTRATYNADNTITELPGMEKPPIAASKYEQNSTEYLACKIRWDEYNAHLATLRRIPCSPECRGLFEVGKVYEEGREYEVRPVAHIDGNLDRSKRWTETAFPLPVKCEDDFLKSIDEMDEGSKLFVDKSMAIANRICELLESKGIKQKDLAELMGKTEAEISRMLSGMHNLTMRTISKIEAVLESDIICIPEAK